MRISYVYMTLPPGGTMESLWNHVTFGEGEPVTRHENVALSPVWLSWLCGLMVTTCGLIILMFPVCNSPSVWCMYSKVVGIKKADIYV